MSASLVAFACVHFGMFILDAGPFTIVARLTQGEFMQGRRGRGKTGLRHLSTVPTFFLVQGTRWPLIIIGRPAGDLMFDPGRNT